MVALEIWVGESNVSKQHQHTCRRFIRRSQFHFALCLKHCKMNSNFVYVHRELRWIFRILSIPISTNWNALIQTFSIQKLHQSKTQSISHTDFSNRPHISANDSRDNSLTTMTTMECVRTSIPDNMALRERSVRTALVWKTDDVKTMRT